MNRIRSNHPSSSLEELKEITENLCQNFFSLYILLNQQMYTQPTQVCSLLILQQE